MLNSETISIAPIYVSTNASNTNFQNKAFSPYPNTIYYNLVELPTPEYATYNFGIPTNVTLVKFYSQFVTQYDIIFETVTGNSVYYVSSGISLSV